MPRIRPCVLVVFVLLGVSLAVPAAATPPGKNGQLLWQQAPGDFPHLLVADPDGSDQRRVLNAPNRGEFEGAFSPTDSNSIAFSGAGVRPFRPFSERIFIGDLLTGAVTKVRTGKVVAIAPSFSPDGRRIAFFDIYPRNEKNAGDQNAVFVVNTDGSGLRRVTSRSRSSFDPDFSPDGKQIVYTEGRDVADDVVQNRIVVIGVNGSNRRVLTRYGGPDEINPKWTPDGKRIVFERITVRGGSPAGTRSDIVTMDPSGKDVKAVLATNAYETNPIPSPDGTRIVFTSDRDRRGKERLGPGFEVYTMKTDGTDIVRVTNNRTADVFPDWQRLP